MVCCFPVPTYFLQTCTDIQKYSVKKQICLKSFLKNKYIHEFILFCYYGHQKRKQERIKTIAEY